MMPAVPRPTFLWLLRASVVLALASAACSSEGDAPSGGTAPDRETASAGPSTTVAGPSGTAATGPTTTGAPGTTAATGPTGTSGRRPTSIEPDPDNLACSILTEDLVEPIVGVNLFVVGDVAVPPRSSCVLRDRSNSTSIDLRLTEGRDAHDDYRTLYAQVRREPGVRDLDGLGDEAFSAIAGINAHVLVLVDDTLVRLSTADQDGALEDEALELAEAIVGVLPS